MIPSLVPEGVVVVEATQAMWDGDLDSRETEAIANAVPKRRREFTAGRNCARAALAQLGIVDFPLLVNEDRTPCWPEGIVGSITHTTGYCAVVVARQADVHSVGIDVETAGPLKEELTRHVCTPDEVERLASLSPGSLEHWGKVAFSAKESLYKCYYALTRCLLDFQDVEIELLPELRWFTGRLLGADKPAAWGKRVFQGRFACNASHVFTVVALTAAEPRAH